MVFVTGNGKQNHKTGLEYGIRKQGQKDNGVGKSCLKTAQVNDIG
jgi:hypothetical protein